ncbi:HD-GYP domain-containing protein [Paenibacillus frigoriresistens]|uniref:HD-GYP domain-containing protein n=1 Tax=Paenibacillus alginolyticus TaxID=59839 RepID=UPI0015679F7A|nr:HD-GYP domain-containing protein [Paenibacillus frigoriresistens]NRF92271.1 HD-GYP domain-containing protein [Paenibacillus frigoriresistens]
MRIHVLQLIVGDKLISDSYNMVGLHLLSSGTVVDAGDILMLNRHNVDYVDIQPRGSEAINELDEPTDRHANNTQLLTFNGAISGIKDLFSVVENGGSIQNETIESAFNPMIQSFQEEKDVVSLLLSLNSKDDYTYQHSVQVGMLSYYIAKWMKKSEKEALQIGKAGYLHDIGKSKIHSDILHKPSKLTNDEYSEIQKHTIYGYEIIKNSLNDNTLALVALEHHERMDGTGYPLRKKSTEIHSYSLIIAVADVYSAMICNRVYQQKRDLLVVLKELHRMSFGQLDPKITQIFIRNMIPNFIGKKVSLSDGRVGTIVMTNPTDFFRPLININNQFFDLSQLGDVEITKIAI